MRGHFKVGLGLVAGLSAGMLAAQAKADTLVANGDFGTGDLTFWNNAGNASVQDSQSPVNYYEVPPSGNEYMGLVSGAQSTGDTGPNNPVTGSALDTALGISDSNPNSFVSQNAAVGSVIYQSVFIPAGQSIKFNADYLTDQPNDGSGDQYSAASLYITSGSNVVSLQTIASPTNAVNLSNTATPIPLSPFSYESGWIGVVSAPVAVSGVYTIAIAAADSPDNTDPSAVLVDNVVVTPEPASLSLLGLGGLALLARRRRNKQT